MMRHRGGCDEQGRSARALAVLARRPTSLLLTLAAAVVALALSGGCVRRESALDFVSFRDPHFPETYRVAFDVCVYRTEPAGDYQIAARSSRMPAGGGGPVVQMLHIHVFWKPRPGRTFDDPTGVDAALRYVVSSDAGTSVYRGTGFVYPRRERFGGRLVAEVESGRLLLDSRRGEPPEVLGDARVSGRLYPLESDAQTIGLIREVDRAAGPGQ